MENEHYLDLAHHVLTQYELNDPQLTFIRHNENVTFQVSTSSGSYLLRIHLPVTDAIGGHGADYDMVLSEAIWLSALNDDTSLILQKPVPNRSGNLVSRIEHDNFQVNCTLLSWIDGDPYYRELESPETAFHIGEILATLHNHASQWQVPQNFKRPVRDHQYFQDVLIGIIPAVEDGRITRTDFEALSRAIEKLQDLMKTLNKNSDRYGIMHADGHKGNMLYSDGDIRLIDFSFCAFGDYMFDLGVCMSDMKQELHAMFLKGYQTLRCLPENHEQLIEGFFVGSIVGTFSFWVKNPKTQEVLSRKVPQITRDFVSKFNTGNHFWFR